MFKVGDIVRVHFLERKTHMNKIRYRIGYFRELQGTFMLEEINGKYVIEALPKNLVLDIDYMRKMKIKKICSKLEI